MAGPLNFGFHGWLALVAAVLATAPRVGAQATTPILFDRPANMSQAQHDALALELTSRNYRIENRSAEAPEAMAAQLLIEERTESPPPTVGIQLLDAEGNPFRALTLPGPLADIDARSLAIAVGSLFDTLPRVILSHELPSTDPAVQRAASGPPEHEATSHEKDIGPPTPDEPNWTPKPKQLFVMAQGGVALRTNEFFNSGGNQEFDLQGALGLGVYLAEPVRLELSVAVATDTFEPLRVGLIFDLPAGPARFHAGFRGAVLLEAQQVALALGAVTGLLWETFDDVLMGLRLYVGAEQVVSGTDPLGQRDVVVSASFHTTLMLDP